MKNFLSIIFIIIIVTSCAPGSEKSNTSEDLDKFLLEVEQEYKEEGPIINSASWISSNFITYDSQKVIADYGTRYTLKSLETSRRASDFNNVDTSPEQKRMLNIFQTIILTHYEFHFIIEIFHLAFSWLGRKIH